MKKYLIMLMIFDLSCGAEAQRPLFKGQFKGEQSGISSSADLQQDGNKLKGSVLLNGKKATVSGIITDSSATGMLDDAETDNEYAFQSYFSNGELHFSITFPELNNQVIELIMQRSSAVSSAITNTAIKNPSAKKDQRLIGVWRYTEVLSSGSGGDFGSFSTDYFMEMKSDGTLLSWRGKSAGGSGDVSVSSGADTKADKGEWYTEGKTLFMIDPATNQKVSVQFIADANRIMFQNGNNKRVWQRVQ